MHFIRTNILAKLLKLMAMILEVPEEVVLATHAPGGSKTEYIRYVSATGSVFEMQVADRPR